MRVVALAMLLGAAVLPQTGAHAVARKHGAAKKHAVARKIVPHGATAPAPALSAADAFLATNARQPGVVRTASGLQYRVLAAGTGAAKPTDADVALVNYVGTLIDGTVFDQSAQPTPMPVSAVVPGFSESLKLMAKGAKYRVWIKPSLGYGDRAAGPIPAGSVLVFDIELVDFRSRAELAMPATNVPAPN